MTLGEQIKQARERRNFSQEDLAEQLGVSRQAVSKWENDSSIPQGINRESLSQLLNLSIPPLCPSTRSGRLGWLMAGLFLILFLCSTAALLKTGAPANTVQTELPTIRSVIFYDSNQNQVNAEALWYNAAQIESILIQWDGGTPDNIKMFSIPSGTETTEMTELLLTKMVSDGDSAELLNADALKGRFQSHVFFELDFGGAVIASDQYNIFFDETLVVSSH